MTCNATRYSKQKYCLSDFRHEITIKKIHRNASFGNDATADTITTFNIFAIIQDFDGSNYTSIDGDAESQQMTHLIIIPYVQELQVIVENSRAYTIQYINHNFVIRDIKQENMDRGYIRMKVSLLRS